MDPPDWFDDSSQVPCTEPHTTETALVIELSEPTTAEAKERVNECWNFVRVYVGINSATWVPWTFVGYLPSKQEVAAGASWLRCDAAFPETWAFDSARTTTETAHGLAYDHPQDFWACLDQPPAQAEQPFVSCDQPHAYEETGKLAILNGITQYPSAATLAAQARTQCRLGVPHGYRDVSVLAVWDPRSTLKQSSSIAGPCFMFNADGKPLPAR